MPTIKSNLTTTFRGFIFDVDGTMINSMKMHLKAWQTVLEKYGRKMSIKEVGEISFGINPEIVRRALGNDLVEEQVERISNEKEELFRASFDPEEDVIKGFLHFINELKNKNIPMVIGSAAPMVNIDYFMDRLGIGHYFEGIVHEDDVKIGKPSPEVFLKAAEKLNIPIEDCLVFEDSPTGAEASAKAGSKTIAVLTSKSKSDFKDIPNIIEYIRDYTDLLEENHV